MKTDSRCLNPPAALIFQGGRLSRADGPDVSREVGKAFPAAMFWELLAPVNRKVYSFIRKSVGFNPDADDVFQETVLQAFRYFRTFRRDARFETWLFSIAHNEVRKHFKRNAKPAVPLDTVRPAIVESVRRNDLVREVFRFAGTLQPRSREVFFLFYDSGFSIGEISGITGLREGNVKFILSRARASLRAIMGEKDE